VQTLWETCGADGDAIVAEAARGRFLGAMQAGESLRVEVARNDVMQIVSVYAGAERIRARVGRVRQTL